METNVIETKIPTISNRSRRRGYIRVSTRDQLKGFGLDVQEAKIKDYLRLYGEDDDVQNLKVHVDRGLSGKNMRRTALRELLEDVKKDKVDEIIIYKLDRIARNVNDVYYIISLLIDHNCNLISVMDHLDIYTANGRLLIGILAVLAQWERETDLERTLDSTLEQLEEGLYPFGAPMFGFNKEGKKLVVNEKEAEAVRFIVKKACEGMTVTDISKELKLVLGIDKKDFRIKDILNRDYYASGNYCYKGKYYPIVPPIIELEELALARKVMKKRSYHIKNDKYHFRNKIRTVEGDICVCRTTKKKTHHVYYYEHEGKRINQKLVDRQVLFQTMIYANEKNKVKENKRIRHQILKLQKKIDEVYNLYLAGEMDAKTYGFSIHKLNDQIERKKKSEVIITQNDMDLVKWNELSDMEKVLFVEEYIVMIIVDLELKTVVSIQFK